MLELLAWEYRPLVQDALAIILLACAWLWGGAPERVVATTWVLVFQVAGTIKTAFWGDQRQRVEVDLYLASEDLVAGLIFIAVALYANRNYTLWIAAMQLLAMFGHVARGLAETITPVGYAIMTVAPGWFQLFFLAIGLSRHVLRERKHGTYRDWRFSRVPGAIPSIAAQPRWVTAIFGKSAPAPRDDR